MSVFRQIFQGIFPGLGTVSPTKGDYKENTFYSGSYSIPRRDKLSTGGEDAYICSKQLISVADGVGGWVDLGVDPQLYAKELCYIIERLFKENQEKYMKNPKKLLIDAVSMNQETGTSTSIILTIDDKKPILYSCNIGDSGFMILRKVKTSHGNNLKVVFQSKEQYRAFNYPYQVGTNGDNPMIYAGVSSHNIKNNDIIVCGSDGLFDNLDCCHIVQGILPFLEEDRIVESEDGKK